MPFLRWPGLTLIVAVSLSACTSTAHFKLNRPLQARQQTVEQAAPALKQARSDDLLLMLSFSGGGTRASALSYGVLQEMRDTSIRVAGKKRRLLDEVDYIASVSGGSFTAAYYGLFGDRVFEDFESSFLRKDIERELAGWLSNIDVLKKLVSPTYGRSDAIAEYYGKHLFESRTIGDLLSGDGPVVEINAMDLGRGSRFGFSSSQLETICTDPYSVPVSRAVAASSAVPVLFSPVTLRNYAGECEAHTPHWVDESLRLDQPHSRRYREARLFQSYTHPGKRKYIHLLDGGLADNLGVRASIVRTIRAGSMEASLIQRGMGQTRRIVFVVVDAATRPPAIWDETPANPPTEIIASAATSAPLEHYNIETLDLLRSQLQEWKDHAPGREFNIIHLGFDGLPEPERTEMQSISTSFALESGQVDKLIEVGRLLLREDPEYQRWMAKAKAP